MYQAPIVTRAFQILELIARHDGRIKISDISRELGISKGTVHGIARALEQAGAVTRDEKTKCYSLGYTLFALAQRIHSRIELKDVARPIMQELMRKTQQSVFLGIRSNDRVSIIDIVESTRDLKISAPIGARLPILAGALGKVFMAAMSDREAEQWIRSTGLRQDTAKSITEPRRYLKEVRQARELGYALDDEEYIQGVRAVAVPINVDGGPLAAIWVVGFTQSMSEDNLAGIVKGTKEAAQAITRTATLQAKGKEK